MPVQIWPPRPNGAHMASQETLDILRASWGTNPSQSSPILLPHRTREDLALLFRTLGFSSGAEIGVALGLFSKKILTRNPGLRLLCVDKWGAYPAVPPDSPERTQEQMDAMFARARLRLGPPHNTRIIRAASIDAAQEIPDGSLDFVYIDASHKLPDVIADLAAWQPKVRCGGIIAGHDFTHTRFKGRRPLTREAIFSGPAHKPCHVIEAVRAWTSCYQIEPWFVLDGLRSTASWMWVNQLADPHG